MERWSWSEVHLSREEMAAVPRVALRRARNLASPIFGELLTAGGADWAASGYDRREGDVIGRARGRRSGSRGRTGRKAANSNAAAAASKGPPGRKTG